MVYTDYMNKKKDIVKRITIALVFQIMIYVVQYVLIPFVYEPKPYDENACYLVLGLSTFIVTLIGQAFFIKKIYGWVCSLFIYPVLVLIYHPTEIYGIGYRGHALIVVTEIDVLVWTIFVLGVELLTCIIVYIVNFIKKKKTW